MAIDLTVPDWLQAKCSLWIERLAMSEWEVALGLALAPNDDADLEGFCEHYPDLNLGRIVLRADAVDDQRWETVLVHELLHIKHGRIDSEVMRGIAPHVVGVPYEMIDGMYKRAVEPFINSLAKELVKLGRV